MIPVIPAMAVMAVMAAKSIGVMHLHGPGLTERRTIAHIMAITNSPLMAR